MRRREFVALLLATPLLSSPTYAMESAPDFSLPTAQGTISLSEMKGRVIYLDFWASWCTPCRQSFPWMNAMQDKYGSQGLTVIAVNLDKDESKRGVFLQAVPANFTIAYDPEGHVAERYKVMGMPSSYLIGRDGQIHDSHIGFRDKDKQRLEQQIIDLLSAPAMATP